MAALAPRADLPAAVSSYLERSLPAGDGVPRQIRLAQEGHMRTKPGGRELHFTATHRVAVGEVAFSWQARFPLVGPLALTVVDGYAHGEGQLEVRLFGLLLQRQRGRETVIGEALRYLAELPWAPHAVASNPELEWRELDARRVEVATTAAGERLVAEIEFDEDGDIVRTSSTMRPLRLGKRWTRQPWGGDFGEHALLGGTRIPTRAEAYWELDEGRFVYWRGRVTSVELEEEPLPRSGR